jgi:uncharacterized iron-regulated membrane protein
LAFRRRVHIGMKWLRSKLKYGARLTLLALVVQFAVSFGHFHGFAAQAAPGILAQANASHAGEHLAPDGAVSPAQQQPAPDSGQPPSDACAICAVIALANTVLFATPPLLLLPQALELLYQTTDAEFAHLNSASIAFQPRAPPAS